MDMLLDYPRIAPGTIRALSGLNAYSDQCSIPQALRRLLEVLVSEMNGCSYCIQVHRRQAVELGEDEARLNALSDWRGSDLFSGAERAALEWAEYVTSLESLEARERLFAALQGHYTEKETVDLTFVVPSMNAWNRIGVSFRHEAE